MSDIDFDELDKAVNNLMGGAKGGKKEEKEEEKDPTILNTVDIDSAKESAETKEADEPTPDLSAPLPEKTIEPISDSIPEPTPASSSPTPVVPRPRQSSGRFMDMVHPSADMRTSTSTSPSVSRFGPKADESTDSKNEELIDPEQQTPFLPDANAKVSKRPLGAGSWPFGQHGEEDADKPEQQEPEKPEAPVVPDEPEHKVVETVSINSDEIASHKEEKGLDGQPPDPTHIEAEPTEEDRKLQSIESMEVDGAPVDDETIRQVESADTEKLRAGDEVVEDKKKQPVEHAEPNGAIYDVKNYHQPLGHPAKQKSGWGTVIIIMSIIVICVAVGAALFFVFGGGI